jgi:hypothetical protein
LRVVEQVPKYLIRIRRELVGDNGLVMRLLPRAKLSLARLREEADRLLEPMGIDMQRVTLESWPEV